MQTIFSFLLQYGYVVLFLNVFAEQVGLPLPAVPVLLAMGAMAGAGKLSTAGCLALATAGGLLGDWIWYELGRRRGHAILNLLCRVSLEPDSCVSNTKRKWNRFGGYTLVIAKFVPGLSTVSPPLAGLTRMRVRDFLALDLVGTALWAAAYLGVGFLFGDQMERAAEIVQRLGSSVLFLVVASAALYIGWKYYNRRRFIKNLNVGRVTPEELMQMMSSGEDLAIIDLRSATEVRGEGLILPSAIWIDPVELEAKEDRIPRDKEVVLYCS